MLSPYIQAALAHERQQAFLAQAATDRQARQARLRRQQAGTPFARRSLLRRCPAWLQPGWSRLLGYWPRSAATGRPVILRDGSTVLIRQVQSADAPLLADGFARLSARARQMRFLRPKKEISPAELSYFTLVVDLDHEAENVLTVEEDRARVGERELAGRDRLQRRRRVLGPVVPPVAAFPDPAEQPHERLGPAGHPG